MKRQHRRLTGLIVATIIAFVACSPPATRQDALQAIARWEDRRLAPADSLTVMIGSDDAAVRKAALRAAGRIGRTDVMPAMIEALRRDPSQAVRSQAAFSLGLLADAAAEPALAEAVTDPHEAVRLAALAGLARIETDPRSAFALARGGNAREAVAAWNVLIHQAENCDRDSLARLIPTGLARPEKSVRWRALRCAQLAPDSTLAGAIIPFATDRDPQVRTHALRALGKLSTEASLAAVVDSGEDLNRFEDYHQTRCRVQVLRALGELAGPALASDTTSAHTTLAGRAATLLITGATSADPHVAKEALAAMARTVAEIPLPPEAAAQVSLLPVWRIRMVRAAEERLQEGPPVVRAVAVTAFARLRGEGGADQWLELLDGETSPVVLATAIVEGFRTRRPYSELLEALSRLPLDTDPRLRVAVVAGLMARWRDGDGFPVAPPPVGYLYIEQAAQDPDFTVAATALPYVGHLRCGATANVLAHAFTSAVDRAEGRRDVRLAALEGIATLKQGIDTHGECDRAAFRPRTAGEDSLYVEDHWSDAHAQRLAQLLRSAFDDRDLHVRLKAREVALATALLPPQLVPSEASLRATLPAHDRDPRQPALRLVFDAPRVRCVTDRGTFVIELDGQAAPNTCAMFVDLVERGFYDGLVFHRVVPDFVIQGGDPRGDGWGGPGWTIRSEWSRRPFRRGTVGIAHSGKDTGGSQWFVCHSPQPHLDARYTVFGEVVDGMDTVDAMVEGDTFRLEIETD